MKKSKMILVGIFTMLFYFVSFYLNVYLLYNSSSDIWGLLTYYLLPALPGILLAFLLVRKNKSEFCLGLGISILSSLFTFLIYAFSGIDSMIYSKIMGYEEASLGEGILFVGTFFVYIISCIIGSAIAGIRTAYLQWKRERKQ